MANKYPVAYIEHKHYQEGEAPLGRLVVEYLIDNRLCPLANVIFLNDLGEYESLYDYNLFTPLEDVTTNFRLDRANFASDKDTIIGLKALREFLVSEPKRDFERSDLLRKVERKLEEISIKVVRDKERLADTISVSRNSPYYPNPKVTIVNKSPSPKRVVSRSPSRSPKLVIKEEVDVNGGDYEYDD